MLTDTFLQLKSNLELTKSLEDLVQQRHNAVRGYLHNNNSHVLETKLIGSIKRKTRIQPAPNCKFDIDVLVIFGSFYSWLPPGASGGVTPAMALAGLHHSLNQSNRYGAMNPLVQAPTISVEYNDRTVVEFVPAYVDQIGTSPDGIVHSPKGRAYWVPKNGKWELADYDFEADYITSQNALSDGWLIPTIKMLKAIKRNYFPQMQSFQLDIVASNIIPLGVTIRKNRRLEISYPELIRDFFFLAQSHLSAPIQIPGSHSPAIVLNQSDAAALADTFQKIESYIASFSAQPQEYKRKEGWKLLFGDPFPSS